MSISEAMIHAVSQFSSGVIAAFRAEPSPVWNRTPAVLGGLQAPLLVARQFDPYEPLHRQIVALPSVISDNSTFFEGKREAAHPTNCKNCGAVLHSSECEYCETRYA